MGISAVCVGIRRQYKMKLNKDTKHELPQQHVHLYYFLNRNIRILLVHIEFRALH